MAIVASASIERPPALWDPALEVDMICQELLQEHPPDFVDGLSVWIGDIVAYTYPDDLPESHKKSLRQYQLCTAKAGVISALVEADGFEPGNFAKDGQDDDYYTSLVPDHLGEFEEELVGFLKDLAILDLENIFRVQKWAIYERRRADAMVRIIETRIRTCQLATYMIGLATQDPAERDRNDY